MTNEDGSYSAADSLVGGGVTGRYDYDSLAIAVHAGFSRRFREQITVDGIRAVLTAFELREQLRTGSTPLLRLLRLRFAGEKSLRTESTPRPISYDQSFQPGVNVVLVEDNQVGKSSIMKTIKFALTGDNSDYDHDVRGWIHDIWLSFSLDTQVFTVVLSMRDGVRGAMILGEEFRPIEDVNDHPGILWNVVGLQHIQDELRRFFFLRLGLNELSWTYQPGTNLPVQTPSTTWLTYFQALQVLDDRYLICDPSHSYGNQEGLILSSFLGLRMVESLNALGVEAQRSRKEHRLEKARTSEEALRIEEEISHHTEQVVLLRDSLAAIDAAQLQRREMLRKGPPSMRLVEVQSILATDAIERRRLLEVREDLGQRIRQARAEARRLREAVQLRLHFTGLNVSLCPSCDSEVDEAAVRREEEEHLCRLCGRTPPSAPAEDTERMVTLIAAAESRSEDLHRERAALNKNIQTLDDQIETLMAETISLQQASEHGLDLALPTLDEERERLQLAEQIGGLNAQIRVLRSKLESGANDDWTPYMRVRVLEKAREILKRQAQELNKDLVGRLTALIQDVVHRIGVDSIAEVTILPYGDLQFSKHGVRVTFGSLQNQGDRLRVKLALFLAMMRLGREPSFGRHPGLLLIDQPGGAEMVDEDSSELARVFCSLDRDLADDMQILCFAARPQFAIATVPSKVYGPQGQDGRAF